ncbi:phosphatidylinositol 3-kinase regulatory subunit alpha-like isoform X2 [Perca flavescens]|uniref:phosphatidylinositol 3-kinase regulatory subunit alpha-like isoform X2 n=1 Tax=Perca flavescens TaxID=8167 RepID=UPI00106E66CB|nr:phosphatidylinositol 3-kinase regulatory subunit alpha-like isoform X2 [Perca flavescens]
MTSDSFQYRVLFEYKRERGDDISLQPGDLLTVSKASLMAVPGLDYQDGDERSPKGWLHGTNERTKEKGDFPGTFVEYVGVVRVGPPAVKSWPRPVPPTPGGPQSDVGAQPPGAAAASAHTERSCLQPLPPLMKLRAMCMIAQSSYRYVSSSMPVLPWD